MGSGKNTVSKSHLMQGQGASAAPSSYNVYKSKKSTLPPVPKVQPTNARAASSACVETTFSHSQASDSEQAFAMLWALWPVKKGRESCRCMFCPVPRAGRLLAAHTLLSLVSTLSECDQRVRSCWSRLCAEGVRT